ncbi:MAG: hypothetical protein WC699_07825 [Bacteroidales bacterium]
MHRIILIIGFFMLPQIDSQGQIASSKDSGLFKPRDFGCFLLSDMYSPVTNIQIGLGSNGADFNNDPERTDDHLILEEITLGADIPFFSTKLRSANQVWRLSVSGILSSVIWFDFLNPISAPILNVDYRLSCPEIMVLKEFTSTYLKNFLLRIAPLQHESTHIGDELTLYRKSAGFPISRIDVSYESGEASITLNDPGAVKGNNHAISLGGKLLYSLRSGRGFYSMHPWEGETAGFVSSTRRLESYIRYQYDGPDGPLRIGDFYPVISAEVRFRVKFGYPYYETDTSSPNGLKEILKPESYAPCLNFYAGWHQPKQPEHHGSIGGYFRYYQGINPHGQFRNIPVYSFIGLVLIYEPSFI